MEQVNDKVLSAVNLLQRVIPRLNANDRSTIRRQPLLSIQQSVTMTLKQLYGDCTSPLVLTPLMEVVELIDSVVKDDTFVETDAETKAIIVDKLNTGLSELYLFAGKYYMTHEFNYVPTKSELLVTIINECLARGFYFGEDEVLRREGII
jgi:hypothetical protein